MRRMDKHLSRTAGDGLDEVYEVELVGSMVGPDEGPWFAITEEKQDENLDEEPDKERALRGVRCALQRVRM